MIRRAPPRPGKGPAALRRFGRDPRGVAAIEFAVLFPVLLLVYMGGFDVSRACALSSRLNDMTLELCDVASQYDILYDSDLSCLFAAASQIMTPDDTLPVGVVISEVSTDGEGRATVTWSQAANGAAPLVKAAPFPLATGLAAPNVSYIVVQTHYVYQPFFGVANAPVMPLSAQAVFAPRNRASIDYAPST